jgi:fatty-acid desaturase
MSGRTATPGGGGEVSTGSAPEPVRFRLNWPVVVLIVGLHVALLATPWYYTLDGLLTLDGIFAGVVLWWLALGVGITLGWHRLLTHRSFKTYRSVRYALTACGCVAAMGPPLEWVGIHRLHHREADAGGDPHSPRHGLIWGHIGWLFPAPPYQAEVERCVADLKADPGLVLINRLWFVPPLAVAAGLFWVGGVAWLVWGGVVRTVFCWHCSFLVNSAAHSWGYRNFECLDGSRNNPIVALLTFGEGWHNNHHFSQRCAAHGRRWWEIDPTFWMICLLERTGLVWGVVRPEPPAARPVTHGP